MIPALLLEVHDIEPRVDIARDGWSYRVVVLDQRTRLGGQFGWTARTWTRRGAERLAGQVVADVCAKRAARSAGAR